MTTTSTSNNNTNRTESSNVNVTPELLPTTTSTTSTTATTAQSQSPPQIQLLWKTKKRSRQQQDVVVAVSNQNNNNNNSNTHKKNKNHHRIDQTLLQSEFSIPGTRKNDDIHHQQQDSAVAVAVSSGPLVIPVAPDQNKWKKAMYINNTASNSGSVFTSNIVDNTTAIYPDHHTSLNSSQNNHSNSMDNDDLQAIQSSQDEIQSNDNIHGHRNHRSVIVSSMNNTNHTRSEIEGSNNDNNNKDLQQYIQDVQSLPAALEETADEYHRVPISEFGAALLRGMGWKDNDDDQTKNNNNSNKNNNDILPRPHRLGLGAIPAATDPTDVDNGNPNLNLNQQQRRYRNMDQYQRDKRVQEQNALYRIQREKKIADDLQRTMQNGSIVYIVQLPSSLSTITSVTPAVQQQQQQIRAKIIKLVGVPGLNMVQIQIERSNELSVIKRKDIDRLVSRDELEQCPFIEITNIQNNSNNDTKKNNKNPKASVDVNGNSVAARKDLDKKDGIMQNNNNDHEHDHKDSTKHRKSHHQDGKNTKGERLRNTIPTWVIPNIRVRIITEKLGRQYYKEKGVVVDVTSSGITLQLYKNHPTTYHQQYNDANTAIVLDQIPERYLETALPKVGGNVIVVNPERNNTATNSNRYMKGRLLERDSRYGVVQFYDDLHCSKLPLDDIAEWCGPLDHDEEQM